MTESVAPEDAMAPRVSWAISSDQDPDAFDIYRDTFAEFGDVRDVPDQGRIGFFSQTQAHLFGPMVIGRARSTAQTLAREARHVRQSGIDHINLIVNRTEMVGDCDGRSVRAEAGSVQFRDMSRPATAWTQGVDLLTVMIPRAAVPGWLLRQGVHGLVLPGSSAGGRLVAAHLSTLLDVADDVTEAEGQASIQAVFAIAERFMGREQSVSPTHTDIIQRTIRERTVFLIESWPKDQPWSPDDVARAIGVSRTSLYRAFESVGGVKVHVQNRRLARAYAALRGEAGGRLAIPQLALKLGFADAKAFGKAFVRRFGVSPQDVAALSLSDTSVAAAMHRARHDVIADWMRLDEVA